MARRKRVLDDGDDSDSSEESITHDFDMNNDPDTREERALFEDPYQRKRRRRNGKEDALFGIFAEDSDEGGHDRKLSNKKRSDWTKAPAFVSGESKVQLEKDMVVEAEDEAMSDGSDGQDDDGEDDGSEGEDVIEEDPDDSDDSEPSRLPSPRVRNEEEEDNYDEKPRMGGIGSKPSGIGLRSTGLGFSGTSTSRTPNLSATGIGFSRGGIGSKPAPTVETVDESTPSVPLPPASATKDLPSSFGKGNQRFQRESSQPRKAAALNASEYVHFSKIQNTFGARMLAKMGWQAGTGLGVTGEGIVTPIESKLRPQKMGIAFKGFREKTEQSKMEARRRGEVVSSDEDEKAKSLRKRQKKQQEKRSDVWKRPKKVKTKTEHKSYEQIIAEAGEEAPATGLGQIIDATGAIPREVSSLADISLNNWAVQSDLKYIPEVRHNVRLIADACKSDLDGLAREAKALEERKKWVNIEDTRLRKQVQDEADLIARLQKIQIVTNDIDVKSKELASIYEVSLEPLSPLVHTLVDQFAKEFDLYRLDEIVVAAIAPLVRRMVATWDPLNDPIAFVTIFRGWRRALKINTYEQKPQIQVDVYGTISAATQENEKIMTPFESLLWNIWLPKVRTAINNTWSPENPQPALKLYEAWSTFLPLFIKDNLLDQLILPKVQKAVADWNPKRSSVSLHSILFPWLPHVGLRVEDVVGDAKRKIRQLLQVWTVAEEKPKDLLAWMDIFDAGDWDAMMLKYVVPKLGATLRDDFRVNPRKQEMGPLQCVLAWSDIIRPSIFSQLLETEFFTKWLDVLHVWLIQPRANLEEVTQWYRFWKEEVFPIHVQNMPNISRGFTRGLQLMNTALDLGSEAPSKLPRPDFLKEISRPNTPVRDGKPLSKAPIRPSARNHEMTFRSIVENFASSHNLLFVPTGRAHERSRMPLFRVSPTADGKGGLLVYILDDAVWAPRAGSAGGEAEEFRAISLDDMVSKASA